MTWSEVKRKTSTFQIIIIGFALVILAGTLLLMQTGGLGVVTIASFIETAAGRRLSLVERDMVEDSISAFQFGGLTLMYATIFRLRAEVSRRPVEKINVG